MSDQTPYQRLSAAGQSLHGTEIFDALEPPSSAQTERYLAENRAPLELARDALRATCAVPLDYEAAFIARHLADLQALRNLGRSFALEATWHAAQQDWSGAARAAVDLLRLAGVTRNGGLFVDALVANAVEGTAFELLQYLLPHLDANALRPLARALSQYDEEREPFAFVECRERNCVSHVEPDEPPDFLNMPWPESADPPLDAESERALRQALQEAAEASPEEHSARIAAVDRASLLALRRLTIEAALAGYRDERNAYPESLSELLPNWLPAVPVDPTNSGQLDYSTTAAGYELGAER